MTIRVTNLREIARWITFVGIVFITPLLSRAADTTPKPQAPIRVVFDRVTLHRAGVKPSNTRVIPWRDGLTAIGAILSAGGYSTPPTRKAKIIRNGTEIPLNLKDLTRGASDVPLQPGDTLFLY